MGNISYRVEEDALGEVEIPANAYYGINTARAIQNFQISGLRLPRNFIKALGLIKYAAAKANMQLGLLEREKAEAIMKASMEVAEGRFDEQFLVDVFQTGSGTSTNMNANEVIANRAIEILGGRIGDKKLIHPNDHVNMCQSTNDVFPTAINVSVADSIINDLLPSLEILKNTLESKASEFEEVIKCGRTHLQDAVPITLGQEFSGYASAITHGIERIKKNLDELLELPIGGTAVGTGLNAHPDFGKLVVDELSRLTGIPFRIARNRFEALQLRDSCVSISGVLKTIAGSILKICNDLRLLSSGPNTGLGEIEIPAVQPGSSIMPGKVNPVILESTMLVCVKVLGNDLSITLANQLGELELNMGMPLIAYDLLQSIQILANSSRNLATKCINGVAPNVEKCRYYAEVSPSLITVITPFIGYDLAAKIARRVVREKKTIREALIEEGFNERELDEILDLKRLTRGGIIRKR
ncbi:MAG: class II fumarate hydratase [Thaumarchaeota archaeon]|jgi:fumarate hydratase class II|nr:class II fumarate hydratase [Candidatus Geocrenenecus arthurdayi]MCL7389483.1 class II fumarate hydratase [Candidatus Geocrenenecus arthurdayi]MCL7391238.1 class II fumarate hydratase [Candidatus Geocrenenecus arthurdayi]MCL7396595.1 class II fumarate hydratase [Candidatus Geocrenenecus arthurdayi]MCL7401718.1 class II fumarate hydratase [Candidatus Geocrenenecus arthurdayi]